MNSLLEYKSASVIGGETITRKLNAFNFFGNILSIESCSGDHIVPNFEEIWPSDKNRDDKYKRRLIGMEYYMDVSSHLVFYVTRRNI